MRFMYDYGKTPNIDTIEAIDACPCWANGNDVNENNPTSFIVRMLKPGWSNASQEESCWFEILGEYSLDGTEETYQKAVENYNRICDQLLEKGYCKASDFENFKWY